jgi:hypothetical protein
MPLPHYRAADVTVYDRNDYVSEIDIAWPIHTGSIAISEMSTSEIWSKLACSGISAIRSKLLH